MPKRLILFLAVIVSGVILFSLTILVLFPADLMEEALKKTVAEKTGLLVSPASFERVFPFGVEARGVRVARPEAPPGPGGPGGTIHDIVFIDRLTIRLKPLSVLTGRIRSRISGSVMGGTFGGVVTLKPGGAGVEIDFNGISLERIAALKSYGVGINGSVSGRMSVWLRPSGCAEGTIKAKGLDLEGGGLIKVRGFTLPFGSIDDTGLDLLLEEGERGCRARLKGLWIDGSGMTARLSGEIRLVSPLGDSPVDLLLEVIPKGDKAGEIQNLVFLAPYKRSANYYSVKVKGTVGRPRI